MPLYAAKAAGATTSDLYTLDPATAAPTSIGATGHALTGLAFRPSDGVLFAVSSPQSTSQPNRLFTVDPLTGTATTVGALGGVVPDIAFDATSALWGWTQDSNHGGLSPSTTNGALVTINTSTGAATAVADSTVNTSGAAIDFLSGVLYALFVVAGGCNLYTVNTGTGIPSLVGAVTAFTGSIPASGGFDDAGLFWWLTGGGATVNLRTLVIATQVRAAIGNPGANFDALAWSPTVVTQELEGVCIAFDDAALTAEPVWTRIDL